MSTPPPILADRGPLQGVPSVVTTGGQRVVTIQRHLGGGTQGDVYAAMLGDRPVAVKWYATSYLRIDTGLRRRLERLVAAGPPGPGFIWPLDLVQSPDTAGFGYVMPLIEPRFVGMRALLSGKIDPSFRALATVGCQVAQGFLDLHARGLCYCDINFGNIWFDPETGATLICDNDNVDVNGSIGAIPGSPRFMAPEIVRSECGPNIATDLHSLAVLLFWMLTMHHPLVGRAEFELRFPGPEDDLRIFGTDPRFIFDPADDSNAPVPGHQDVPLIYWPLYPGFLKALFVQAFTRGLQDQAGRVMESSWRRATARLRDSILTCHGCGAEGFYDPDTEPGQEPACWQCGAARGPVLVLQLGKAELPPSTGKADLVIATGCELFPHHLQPGHSFDFSRPLARVVAHPTSPGIFGLMNLTATDWRATSARGIDRPVPEGMRVQLDPGMTIDFGPVQGAVFLR